MKYRIKEEIDSYFDNVIYYPQYLKEYKIFGKVIYSSWKYFYEKKRYDNDFIKSRNFFSYENCYNYILEEMKEHEFLYYRFKDSKKYKIVGIKHKHREKITYYLMELKQFKIFGFVIYNNWQFFSSSHGLLDYYCRVSTKFLDVYYFLEKLTEDYTVKYHYIEGNNGK